jgi:hypothetical protein
MFCKEQCFQVGKSLQHVLLLSELAQDGSLHQLKLCILGASAYAGTTRRRPIWCSAPQQGTSSCTATMGSWCIGSVCMPCTYATLRLHPRRQCSCRDSKEEAYLVLGTSTGHLQLHSSDGQLMHRQRLHAKAVTAISVRCAGMQAGSDDASEDITVCFENAVARVSSLEV